MMNTNLNAVGYEFEPSRYSSGLGYSKLRVVISGKPKERFFDVKVLRIPAFDGRFLHQKQVTRHELEPDETTQACLGEISLETHNGEQLRAFSFGGTLYAAVETDDLYCEISSTAPIFKLKDESGAGGGLLADEIMDMLAEMKATIAGHGDELYSRLAKFNSYQIFLACMISLQKRIDRVPAAARREGYHKVASNLKRANQIVRETDGWDEGSPSLEELLSIGGIK